MERKLKPFTCYFCNKKIENDTEMGHTSVCGNVLVPCPNKCGSYIPRMEMNLHKTECVNRVARSMTKLTSTTTDFVESYEEKPYASTSSLDRRYNNTDKQFKEMFSTLHNDIQNLSSRLNSYENRNTLNPNINLQLQQRQEFEKIKYQFQLILEWKKAVDYKLDSLKQSLITFETSKIDFANLQHKINAADQLQIEINRLKETLAKEQEYNSEADLEFAKKLDEFNNVFRQENAAIAGLWNDQKLILADHHKEIDDIKSVINEIKAKSVNVVFDLKATTQIASETSEKFEIQEREFGRLKKEVEQLRLDMEILEGLAGGSNTFGAPSSSPGHIIWKISDFDAKMTKAKESETVIKSQIFYTHDFGYRIRLLVYLNGLKKWKDRYALISLHVLKGEYDQLLQWPCHIEATVTLRDVENLENPKHFSKFITAKRHEGDEENEDPQESSSSYIFIPHTTLTKSKHLTNNSIFLEANASVR